ncbi:hypothetical protein [Exiguobacterium flavidum]|uniref:hypothetical protein n=1 Tax=Exiguobacterium flavidum TaxID=2184695 RepID=UPI000DF855B7|nr:hypothetical protein [Exiguobacterium flavidum]
MDTGIKNEERVAELLRQPDQQEALARLLIDLPMLVERLEQLEKSVAFVENVMKDKESVLPLVRQVEQRIESTGLSQAHLQSMIELARLLPEVTPLLKSGVTAALFAKAVVEDERSMNELLAHPPTLPVIEETKRRYEMKRLERRRFTPLRLFRLLRSPVLKQGLLYLESFFETLEFKTKKRG